MPSHEYFWANHEFKLDANFMISGQGSDGVVKQDVEVHMYINIIRTYNNTYLVYYNNKYVTESEKSWLPCTQQQNTLFTIKCTHSGRY